MVKKGDVNIAIMGIYGMNALECSPFCELVFKDPVVAAKETVAKIQANEDADMIVCVSHSGTWSDESKSEDEILAKSVPELDLIISGHTHTKLDEPIVHGDTYIVSTAEYGKYLGSLSMTQKDDGRWEMDSYELITVDNTIKPDKATQEKVDEFMSQVDEKYLKALKKLTLEEVWKPIFVKGYESQFEGRLHTLHDDGRKLVGRAVTATYCPYRPDLDGVVKDVGRSEGRTGTYNQWVVDNLMEGDVAVIDMYDKIYKGTFLGGNLTTALKNKTKTGGAIIWGGIRDVEQMKKVEGVQVYYRGIDPTPIRDFVMIGYNTPTRIGNAICMPGDVVFGAGGGILFIPAHLVGEVVDGAVKTQVKDLFGFEMISQNKFTTAQIDKNTWTKEMLDLLIEFIKTDDRAAEYRDLDWSEEYYLAEHGDPTDTQSAL